GVAWMGNGEAERIAFGQFDALVGELGDADLRALQVAEQCDEAAMACGDVAHQLRPGTVLVRRAVGKIQSSDIKTGQDHFFQHLRRAAGRTKGCNDFGTTRSHPIFLLLNEMSRGYYARRL